MYVELHARSAFSFLEGASTPEALIAACAAYGMPSMALLDRDGLYGAPRFYLAAKKTGLQAHIGAEVSCVGGWRYPLLVAIQQGYHNLCCLITRMKLRSKKGQGAIEAQELEEFSSGLICLTGGREGPLAHALRAGGKAKARKCLEELCATFGKHNVYVELQRHFSIEEERRNQTAIELARSMHLPLLATNGVCHVAPQDRELLDVFTCIRHHRVLSNAGGLLSANSERYFKSSAQMAMLFADLPEAIRNTAVLASRLLFTLKDLGYQFPRYPTPNNESQIAFLRKRTLEGMIQRYGAADQNASRQIEHELSVIQKLDLAGYFLIVWDIVRFCREKNILVQGRGSAANSAVCYSLGITAVDPVGMNLLFERFLSEERGEWPDIDLDLPSGDQRERAIQYVYERYGQLGAAMTANVITYRGKSAAREVGKVLSFDSETLDRLASLVSAWEYTDSKDTLTRQFQDAGLDLGQHRIGKFFELYQKVQDLPRHLGQHSGGMVVCQGQLDSVVPLEPATMGGRVVVQWDKDDCADMGIVKVDLLGLGMMAALEDCLELIPKHYGKPIDLAQLPPDDPVVYKTLCQADTVGMFQVESRAQMSSLPRNSPAKFYDLVVQVAIIRPGPIVGKMMHPYMRRRQGREQVTYAHPSLEPVLKRTLGVPLFQEQLLKMSMIAANFSGGEAEDLRRAMGFKRSEERMHEIETKLRSGMTQNGISREAQEEIITQITSFARYGFPESHAASFALIAYASAFLKVHYLAAFTAALLNNQPMGFYSPATIVKDAQLHGLKVKPIHVLHSDWLCTLEKSVNKEGKEVPCLRIGFRYVRGLREAPAQEIVRERQKQSFNGIEDLIRRVPNLQKPEIVTLSEIGALNSLGKDLHRRSALWQVERAARQAGPLLDAIPEQLDLSPLQKMTDEERLIADFHGSGMTTGPHPMTYCRTELAKADVKSARDLGRIPDGQYTKTAGCVIARQRPGTAKGFVFLSLEDETGIANIIVKPDLYESCRLTINRAKFLRVDGILQNQDGVISIKASRVLPLSVTSANTESHDYH